MIIYYLYLITAAYIVAFGVLLFVSCNKKVFSYRVFAKGFNSMLFVSMATAGLVFVNQNKQMIWMLPAFLGCFAGDIFLAITDKEGHKRFMREGTLAFMLGHILFVGALGAICPLQITQMVIPCVGTLIVYLSLHLFHLETGKMKPYVLCYAFLVSLLFSKGVAIYNQFGDMRAIIILAGVASFLLSDYLILFIYFGKKKVTALRLLNMLTYYLAQYLLALSLFM